MYSVYQHWDPLKVCAVGQSYAPEFYSFVSNVRVRNVLEKIAQETEEDYQKLIVMLQSFGVQVVRTQIHPDREFYFNGGRYSPPPMTPRDYMSVIGTKLYIDNNQGQRNWDLLKGPSWPDRPADIKQVPDWIVQECRDLHQIDLSQAFCKDIIGYNCQPIVNMIQQQGNEVVSISGINGAMTSRIGQDLYFGTTNPEVDQHLLRHDMTVLFPEYRCHVINTGGHSDSTFCPVKPGLIVSLRDIPTYADTFPDWEVVYLPGQSWDAVKEFTKLKQKNQGKWWVPGQELNDDFTDFVESWLNHWVGYVEETVFDVNMLVVDEKNVICNGYNEQVFKAFERHGVTPHIVNFRHRYFWDGGLHCITSDLHRPGTIQDYFSERT